jgi:Ni,Fe-hydrogenase III component G
MSVINHPNTIEIEVSRDGMSSMYRGQILHYAFGNDETYAFVMASANNDFEVTIGSRRLFQHDHPHMGMLNPRLERALTDRSTTSGYQNVSQSILLF